MLVGESGRRWVSEERRGEEREGRGKRVKRQGLPACLPAYTDVDVPLVHGASELEHTTQEDSISHTPGKKGVYSFPLPGPSLPPALT